MRRRLLLVVRKDDRGCLSTAASSPSRPRVATPDCHSRRRPRVSRPRHDPSSVRRFAYVRRNGLKKTYADRTWIPSLSRCRVPGPGIADRTASGQASEGTAPRAPLPRSESTGSQTWCQTESDYAYASRTRGTSFSFVRVYKYKTAE